MKIKKIVVYALTLTMLLASCSTTKNVHGNNKDGSPIWTTEIPSSNKELYGVGKANFSIESNSESAAKSLAISDLGRKVSTTIKESTAIYSIEADSVVKEAYEHLTLVSTNITLKGVNLVDSWISPDGTAWALVSLKVNKLPEIYEDAANDYFNQLKEKRIDAQSKLNNLLAELAENLDESSASIKDLAQEKVSQIAKDIDIILNSIDVDDVSKSIADYLIESGYQIALE